MASRQSQKRLTKEYKSIQVNPPPYIIAKPNEENILEWHYVITGPPNTPFELGQYHGILRFPTEYPFKPPSISIITPNGRFACNTRLCLSMSDYHPDTWNPAWSVATILTGLLSFMTGDESTTGSIVTSVGVKKKLARDSKKWNLNENPRFKKLFPDLVIENNQFIKQQEQLQKQNEHNHDTSKSSIADDEKPINILDNIDRLDPEDRARLLVEANNINAANVAVNGVAPGVGVQNSFGITIVGVVVAAFLAAYFSLIKRG
ncbi:ubiquitin-conjugating enzyme E2 6 [Scheffersomyces coipomensis]|uniref:ubiquitin-conjugating enzyme E2 6 n=1 Tax=Scheffersomyces coipomensis TaxID=1788519 RepID=UPI00315C826B